ncbi:MAG TPA: hypothetical protein VJV04_06065 [Nitrospiraceae bacterium]|nr:hypothetical protein [Nitrospiraceae bacterium]
MRIWLAIGIGLLQAHDAAAADSSKQDKGKGIVNERSTGNEPFTGPGASGGPMHSTPGATEKSMQESTKAQSGMGTGAEAGAKDKSKKSGSGSGTGSGGH